MAAELLMLGDPRLRTPCVQIRDFEDDALKNEQAMLKETLHDFRRQNGFGRGIAAPQIGVLKQFIALSLSPLPEIMCNPRIYWSSPETFSMWDDCMSFPSLLVKLRRHVSISVEFEDAAGSTQVMERLPQAHSELLQHELDHLVGILALDRAENVRNIITRLAYQQNPDYFRKQVDYVIQ